MLRFKSDDLNILFSCEALYDTLFFIVCSATPLSYFSPPQRISHIKHFIFSFFRWWHNVKHVFRYCKSNIIFRVAFCFPFSSRDGNKAKIIYWEKAAVENILRKCSLSSRNFWFNRSFFECAMKNTNDVKE